MYPKKFATTFPIVAVQDSTFLQLVTDEGLPDVV